MLSANTAVLLSAAGLRRRPSVVLVVRDRGEVTGLCGRVVGKMCRWMVVLVTRARGARQRQRGRRRRWGDGRAVPVDAWSVWVECHECNSCSLPPVRGRRVKCKLTGRREDCVLNPSTTRLVSLFRALSLGY